MQKSSRTQFCTVDSIVIFLRRLFFIFEKLSTTVVWWKWFRSETKFILLFGQKLNDCNQFWIFIIICMLLLWIVALGELWNPSFPALHQCCHSGSLGCLGCCCVLIESPVKMWRVAKKSRTFLEFTTVQEIQLKMCFMWCTVINICIHSNV